MLGEEDRAVGAEPDERLLADRHEPGVAGQRVPHRGQDDQDEQRGELLDDVGAEDCGTANSATQPRRPGRRSRSVRPRVDRRTAQPRGAGVSTVVMRARSLLPTQPAAGAGQHDEEDEVPGEDRVLRVDVAPTVCATPRTMPPTSVPHSEPSPPMITASNAKMSWVGPLVGSKQEWMARNAPASVGGAHRDRRRARVDATSAGTPTSSAVSGSWAVARISRPNAVRRSKSCSPPSTATATTG